MRLRPPHPPRRTLRFRLAALLGVIFLATSAGLLAITYALTYGRSSIAISGGKGNLSAASPTPGRHHTPHGQGAPSSADQKLTHEALSQLAQRENDLHQLLIGCGIALAIMAGLAIVIGWLVAGRLLRPLRAMTSATQQITEHNLHQRLALPGPGNEVKDLADTIDDLLGRLQAAFESQRRFVASASHELRTPLTLNRALLEVALADPAASARDLRLACEELLAAGEQQERLVEALLALATTERGLDRTDELDLAQTTGRALVPYRTQAQDRGLRLDVVLGRAIVHGDPDLTERMAANLIDNAIRYNVPGGSVEVRTGTTRGHATLTVANTGPPVPADKAHQLLEPFQRLPDHQHGHPDGHGLGLSIVAAIASAHNAHLDIRPHPRGGLTITACFPTHGPQPSP